MQYEALRAIKKPFARTIYRYGASVGSESSVKNARNVMVGIHCDREGRSLVPVWTPKQTALPSIQLIVLVMPLLLVLQSLLSHTPLIFPV